MSGSKRSGGGVPPTYETATLNSRPDTEAGVVADLALRAATPKPVQQLEVNGRTWLVVPEGASLQEITDAHGLKPAPSRIRQKPLFYEKAAFIEYVNRFKTPSSVVFNNTDENTFDAYIDYHEAAKAGTVEHVARLQLRYSEQFARWNTIEGNWVEQGKFATFLEENYIDVRKPDGAAVLELASDLEAKQNVMWKSAVRRDTETRTFSYEEDLNATQKGKGDVVVPRDLLLALPIYQGENEMELTAFLRHNLVQGSLAFKIDWYRVAFIKLAVQTQIAFELRENCGGIPVFVGVPAGKH